MKLLEKLKIVPNNREIYEQAFIHTSYANEHNKISYERLEYLGDAVLELIISEYLYSNTSLPEGDMTKTRANYVCEKALYEYAQTLDLGSYIKVGQGEKGAHGNYKKAIMADVLEAFIGALYLDKGLNEVKRFINKHIIPVIKNSDDFLHDYKSALQELVQTDKRCLEYMLLEETGPAHNKKFKVSVKINGITYGEGIANSKKEAEQAAAKEALDKQAKIEDYND